MAAWDHFVAPSKLPPFSDIRFGADPSHTPARENQAKESCRDCGGAIANGRRWIPKRGANDPLQDRSVALVSRKRGKRSWTEFMVTPCVVVCGGCGRSVHDGTDAMDRAVKPPLDDDTPSYAADARDKADRTGSAVRRPAKGR